MRDPGDIPVEMPPERSPSPVKMTVDEAARVLGISTGAVRNRLFRNTVESVKENGTVFVLLPPEMSQDVTDTSANIPRDTADIPYEMSRDVEALVSAKDETIRILREQLGRAGERDRENRRIIAGLVQRVPELEAPQMVSEPRLNTEGPPEEERRERSWWRRLFGM